MQTKKHRTLFFSIISEIYPLFLFKPLMLTASVNGNKKKEKIERIKRKCMHQHAYVICSIHKRARGLARKREEIESRSQSQLIIFNNESD